MTRSVGGTAGIERAARDAAVGVPGTKPGGTGEMVAWSSRSGAVGAGAAGAAGTTGVSQSHVGQWQPGESVGAEVGADFSDRSAGAALSQQDTFAAPPFDVGPQQDRFPATGGQHDVAVGVTDAGRS